MIDEEGRTLESTDPPIEKRHRTCGGQEALIERCLPAGQERCRRCIFPSGGKGNRAGGETVRVGVRAYEMAREQHLARSIEICGDTPPLQTDL
jgi:hypothetical protein